MAHRSRSRTADSAENKKSKGTPRRLMEKIAIMKRREHEQSETFKRAMESIHEMQRAQIHGGGGSMPSLQAIDSLQPPSIDMQSVYKDFNEMKQKGMGSFKERPHSGGPAGRRPVFEKRTNSCDTDPYPTIGLGQPQYSEPYWNASTDWIEGDLSRHKSDSDLQQSLMMQAPPLQLPQPFGSPQHPIRNHKLNPIPGELGLWAGKKTRPSSMSAALLSPDQYTSSPDGSLPVPLGAAGGASSLPDLTNIEFSSGLDVPLEHDDPDPATTLMNPYHQSPPRPGLSKLTYSSYQAPLQQQYHPSPLQVSSAMPLSYGYPPPGMLNSGVPNSIFGSNWGQMPPAHNHHHLPPFSTGGGTGGGIRKSPTLPDFRTLQSNPGMIRGNSLPRPPLLQLGSNPVPQFKPILPSPPVSSPGSIPTMNAAARLPPYRPPHGTLPSLLPQLSHPLAPSTPPGISHFSPGVPNSPVLPVPNVPSSTSVPLTPPPMTIIIQPPVTNVSAPESPDIIISGTPQQSPQTPSPLTQSLTEPPPKPQPLPNSNQPPFTSSHSFGGFGSRPTSVTTPITISNSPPRQASSFWNSSGASLPNTPTITIGPALPSYVEARQQQALQQRLASFTFAKTEPLIRSHSEENLQKGQKEKGDLMHNPFMGNLANASSVPCVYVESPNTDLPADRNESPTPGDSPSTSASYASSPPSNRQYWGEPPTIMHEYVFHEWPMEGGGEKNKVGSPLTKSLTDLTTVPDVGEFSPNSRNRSFLHQISLPSVAIGDLAVEEPLEKQSNPTFMHTDFSMEEDVMDSLLKEEVPSLNAFDVGLLGSDNLMSSSPEGFLRNQY